MAQAAKQRHSEIGLVSFFINIFWFFFIAIYISEVLLLAIPLYLPDDLAVIVLFATFILPIITLLLAVIGFFQKNRKKLFVILGTISSAISIILYYGIFIIFVVRP